MWIWKDTNEEVSERQLSDEIYEWWDNEFDDYRNEEFLNDLESDVEIFGVKYGKGTVLRKVDPLMFEMMRQENVQFYSSEDEFELERRSPMDGDLLEDIISASIDNIVWKETEDDD